VRVAQYAHFNHANTQSYGLPEEFGLTRTVTPKQRSL